MCHSLVCGLPVFLTNFNCWSFTGVWDTISFLMSSGHFWIFYPTVIWMVSILPLISHSFCLLFRHLEIIPRAPIIIRITNTYVFYIFSTFWQNPSICLSFGFFWAGVSHRDTFELQNLKGNNFFCFSWLSLDSVFGLGSGDPLVSQSPRKFNLSNFLRQILVYAYTV